MSGATFQVLLAGQKTANSVFLGSASNNDTPSISLGTPSPDRIIVAVTIDAAGILNNVNVSGIGNMTQRVNNTWPIIWTIPAPTGTSATFTLSYSGAHAPINACIAVYAMYGVTSAVPFATLFMAGSGTGNINVPAGGIFISGFLSNPGGSYGAPLVPDLTYTASGTRTMMATHKDFAAAQSPLGVSVTMPGPTPRLAGASWGP